MKIITHLIGAKKRMAVDDAEELLSTNAPSDMAVVLVEEILNDQTCVTDVSPHIFDHIRLHVDKNGSSSHVRDFISLYQIYNIIRTRAITVYAFAFRDIVATQTRYIYHFVSMPACYKYIKRLSVSASTESCRNGTSNGLAHPIRYRDANRQATI